MRNIRKAKRKQTLSFVFLFEKGERKVRKKKETVELSPLPDSKAKKVGSKRMPAVRMAMKTLLNKGKSKAQRLFHVGLAKEKELKSA